jgi:hypothetical protein
VVLDLIVDEGGVEEEEGDLQGTSLNLIPLDYGPADIIATNEKIGFGKFSERAFSSEKRSNIREGIRAEIPGISLVLGSFTERNRHPGGAAHGSIIFRIERKNSHGVKGFDGSAARDPGHFLAEPGRVFRDEVIGHHQTAISPCGFYFAIRIRLRTISHHGLSP